MDSNQDNNTRVEATGPTYLTDLDKCLPHDGVSADPVWRRWRTFSYETDSLSGTMLVAGEETAAVPITYPLRVSGWHAIHIGIPWERHGGSSLQVRLSGDPCLSVLTSGVGWDRAEGYQGEGIRELFWKAADLTGQEINFGQVATQVGNTDEPGAYRCEKSGVAYVKLVPLSDSESQSLQADRQRQATRRLLAHNDAHGYLYLFRATTPEEICREIEPYRNTDFSQMYWEMGAGDFVYYLSKIGRLPTCDTVGDFARQGDRLHAETWRTFRDKGLDPFKVALDYCHEIGLEFHASYRTAGFYFPPVIDQWNAGSLYLKRPDLRAEERDGRQAPRLSYSFPEIRQFVISLLREVAQYPIDGVCILYNRRPPLVGYEPPVVAGFMAEYGQDPRQMDERDERWLRYRSRVLTQFMREVRQAMDEVTQEQGRARRIKVSAIVSNPEENLLHGMDPKAWINEGLIDTLIPYTSAPRLDSMAEAWPGLKDVAYWVAITKGTPCELALNVMPRFYTPEDYRRKAAALYAAGVENMFFWDSAGPHGRANFSPSWNALRRLGHREEIEAWMKAGQPSLAVPFHPLRSIGGWDLSYATPG